MYSLADRLTGKAAFPEFPSKKSVFDFARTTDIVEDPQAISICGQQLLDFTYVIGGDQTLDSPKFYKIMNFFGISIPFCSEQYDRVMEFPCQKLSQGRANDKNFEKLVKTVIRRWQDRWLVVGYNNLFYYEKPEDPPGSVRDNIIFDNETVFKILHIGRTHVEAQLEISRRTLRISIDKTANGLICLDYIIKAFKRSPYTSPHRFTSFAPIRDGNDCIFYADGIGYYQDVYEAFENAKTDIMITDWWFSPEICLKRPITADLDQEESRLDKTLQRAAKRGVRVWILIYKEFKYGLNTDSEHAEAHMESLHHNIRVIRHPNVLVSLWSHHEKIIIVDKKKVFMGGLDLCFGRMDGNNHPLFNDPQARAFPGADYYNPLKKDIVQGRNYKTAMIPADYPRMPWHDIAISFVGPIVNDYVVHYTNYWNHARETADTTEGTPTESAEATTQTPKKLSFMRINQDEGQDYGSAPIPGDAEEQKLRQALSSNSKTDLYALMRQEYEKQKNETDEFEKRGGFRDNEYDRIYGPTAPAQPVGFDPRKLDFNQLSLRPSQTQQISGHYNPSQPRILQLRPSQSSGHQQIGGNLHFIAPNGVPQNAQSGPFGMFQNPNQPAMGLFGNQAPGLSPEFQELFRKTDWSKFSLSGNNADQQDPQWDAWVRQNPGKYGYQGNQQYSQPAPTGLSVGSPLTRRFSEALCKWLPVSMCRCRTSTARVDQ